MWQQENGNVVDFSDPTQVWWRPGKKRLRISTNDLYCQKLDSLTYIFAAHSIGLSLLLFKQLSLEFEPCDAVSLKLLVRRPSFTWNSHSRPTRGSISPYNIAGHISEVSEEVATRIAKKLPSSTTPLSFEAAANRNPCVCAHAPYIFRN